MEGADKQRKEGVEYKANMGTIHTKEQILENEGYYDKDGFYVLADGSFYDPSGYYFDQNGYDEFGGYYENGYYVPGEGYEDEYYRKYEELYGNEQDNPEDFDEYNIEDYFSESDYGDDIPVVKIEEDKDQREVEAWKKEQHDKELQREADRLLAISQHVNPAIQWLKDQPADKKQVVKIENLPKQADKTHIEKLIKNRLERIGQSVTSKKGSLESETNSKIVIIYDSHGMSTGVGYFNSTDKTCIQELLKLHTKVRKVR